MKNIFRYFLNNLKSNLVLISLIFIIFPNNQQIKAKEEVDTLANEYLLGPTDKLYIEFVDLNFLTGFYAIDTNGYIQLPELGKLFILDMTVNELEKYLETKYEESVFNPEINIRIHMHRPLSIYISGEVKNPGLYRFNYITSNDPGLIKLTPNQFPRLRNAIDQKLSVPLSREFDNTKPFLLPSVFDALQRANGVTDYADLSQITIIRKNASSKGGGKIQTNLDFLELLKKGDQSQNIRILDGDSIIVNKTENPIKEQILLAANSNITPDKITVFITGNVKNTGSATIPKGSSLLQAIASAGGKRNFTGKVEFIRFSSRGETIKNKFYYKENAPINSLKNPILMDGDIINVRKTILGTSTELIRELSNPVISGYGLLKIFD